MDQSELQSLIEQRNALDKRIRELEQAQAAEASPFKVGQSITWKHGRGRRRGVVSRFSGVGALVARIVLKNGGDGGMKRVYYAWDDPKLDEVQSHG